MDAETASAEASNAASVISSMSPWMRDSTVPSFCATWRICSACECGIASCNWNAMDCAYGEQYQRSYIAGDMLFGSRRAKSSSGLVTALT